MGHDYCSLVPLYVYITYVFKIFLYMLEGLQGPFILLFYSLSRTILLLTVILQFIALIRNCCSKHMLCTYIVLSMWIILVAIVNKK